MRPHRTIGAALTFLALTLSLAETVWASTCAPMAAGSAAASAVHATQPESDCPAATQAEDGRSGEGAHCPFSPVVGHDCAAAASIAAQPSFATPLSLEFALTGASPARERDGLFGAALFRPPRA